MNQSNDWTNSQSFQNTEPNKDQTEGYSEQGNAPALEKNPKSIIEVSQETWRAVHASIEVKSLANSYYYGLAHDGR